MYLNYITTKQQQITQQSPSDSS